MQKSIMNKYILAISLCFLCLLSPSTAEARLTLGVVSSGEQIADTLTSEKVNAIAASLAGALGEEITVKELADSSSLINWLDRYATLDLALLTARDVADYHGRFLMIGPLDAEGSLNLVARQGGPGDLPGRLAGFVSETGFLPGRPLSPPEIHKEKPAAETPLVAEPTQPVSKVVKSPSEVLQKKPLVSQGRAWVPGDESAFRDILPTDKPQAQKLVLGVVPDSTGIVNTGAQAELLAAYLESALPVEVTVREFEQIETFAAWFLRYRMIDVAVISSNLAAINLGRDYLPVIKLFRSDKPGEESAELVVLRSGQDEDLQKLLQQAILAAPKVHEGKQMMAALNISELFVPGMRASQVEAVDPEQEPVADMQTERAIEGVAVPAPEIKPEPIPPAPTPAPEPPPIVQVPEPEPEAVSPVSDGPADEVSGPSIEAAEDVDVGTLEEAPAMDYPVPKQPVAPAEVAVAEVPVAAIAVAPSSMPPEPVLPEAVPTLPAPETSIIEPAQPAMVAPVEIPAAVIVPEEPLSPALPAAPALAAPEAVVAAPAAPEPPLPSTINEALPLAQKPDESILPEVPAAPVAVEKPAAVDVEIVSEVVPPEEMVTEAQPVIEEVLLEEEPIIEEVLSEEEPVPSHEMEKQIYTIPVEDVEPLPEEDLLAMLGEDPVAAMVAQPNLPQELRPTGVPVVRPRPTPQKTAADVEELLEASIPKPLRQVEPQKPPVLLPQPDPEPGVVYVVPFVSVMVPNEFSSRIFDQFVDSLNQQGEDIGLQFLILKEGLQRVDPEWLVVRKYVTGELYAYVEDSGCCSTDLRSKARLTYRHPHKQGPTFDFEYPVRSFLTMIVQLLKSNAPSWLMRLLRPLQTN